MKKDKLKSLLITITDELKKLSKEELLTEAACAKGFSGIMAVKFAQEEYRKAMEQIEQCKGGNK
jgi:hypothetical protein